MCDELTNKDEQQYLKQQGLTRRQFAGATAGAALALGGYLAHRPATVARPRSPHLGCRAGDGERGPTEREEGLIDG